MSCVKVGKCDLLGSCDNIGLYADEKPCPYYVPDMATAVKILATHMAAYPTRHLRYSVAEAEAFWQQLDWWHAKLCLIVEATEELQE